MSKKGFRIASLFSVLAFLTAGAFAAEGDKIDPKKPVKKAVEEKIVKGKGDVKVSNDEVKNSTTAEVKTRAGAYSCDIHVDNRTNYYINRVYIDGARWGSVSKLGDGIARDVATGATTVYAEVDFTDGSTSSFGPRVFNCDAYATHKWVLR
jgi:hypothetical protein